jgi:DNA-directed RNA polymerase specialized sigma24 family protein
VRLPELDAVGQARTIREIPAVAAEIGALHLGVPEEDLEVHAAVRVSEEAERLWDEARAVEDEARAALQRAAVLRRQAVQRARADGYKLDAAAAAFGVTTSRIQQLAAESIGLPQRDPDPSPGPAAPNSSRSTS